MEIDQGPLGHAVETHGDGSIVYRIWDLHGNTLMERVLSRRDEGETCEGASTKSVPLVPPAQDLPIGRVLSRDGEGKTAEESSPLSRVTSPGPPPSLPTESSNRGVALSEKTASRGTSVLDPTEGKSPSDLAPDALSNTTAVVPPLTWERWLEQLATLALNEREQPWAWGYAVTLGEDVFGELYAQAFEVVRGRVFIEVRGRRIDSGLGMKAINNRAWVARCFPPSAKIPELSWSHHRAVARAEFSDEERRHWLMRARDEHLTVSQLRELIDGPPIPKPTCVCPECGHEHRRKA